MPNQRAIEMTILTAMAFGARLNKHFIFERKNYFYPDLPKGYQISQHQLPIGRGGAVRILFDGQFKDIPLHDIHLEEDTAKLEHHAASAWIDFNRSGVPLVEIVSQPVIRSPSEAKAYVKRIHQVVRWLGISDGDMEKGSMRLEANISLAPQLRNGQEPKLPDYRVEVKNLNSFRFVEKALNYEIHRQTEILQKGRQPKQETRGFDVKKGITFLQRSKEVAKDYRYFPDPDIPPFDLQDKDLGRLRRQLPVLPWQEEEEYLKNYHLKWQMVKTLVENEKARHFWHEILSKGKLPKSSLPKIANIIINKPDQWQGMTPLMFLRGLERQREGRIETGELDKIIGQVVDKEKKAVDDYRRGKTNALGYLMGQIMRLTKGRADAQETQKRLKSWLGGNDD